MRRDTSAIKLSPIRCGRNNSSSRRVWSINDVLFIWLGLFRQTSLSISDVKMTLEPRNDPTESYLYGSLSTWKWFGAKKAPISRRSATPLSPDSPNIVVLSGLSGPKNPYGGAGNPAAAGLALMLGYMLELRLPLTMSNAL